MMHFILRYPEKLTSVFLRRVTEQLTQKCSNWNIYNNIACKTSKRSWIEHVLLLTKFNDNHSFVFELSESRLSVLRRGLMNVWERKRYTQPLVDAIISTYRCRGAKFMKFWPFVVKSHLISKLGTPAACNCLQSHNQLKAFEWTR